MHVVTHVLVGYVVAEHAVKERRDKALVAWASVVPDLDGLGLLADWAGGSFDAVGGYYEQFHRILLHGLPGAAVCAALFGCFAHRKAQVALWAFVSYHLHLVGDILGSRGGGADDFWPIFYLSPLSNALTVEWSGQWPLTGWQNTSITVALMIYAIALAIRLGRSPMGLFNRKADAVFVEALRARWHAVRGRSA
jgi:membrane-bound metal-dependent hydrolase YbcI (DUF457 family)